MVAPCKPGLRRSRIPLWLLAWAALAGAGLTACTAHHETATPPRRATPTTITGTDIAGIGPGQASLAGTVEGPNGPVEGASVQVVRLAGSTEAKTTLTSGPGGAWSLPGILGGRYEVRAWRPPALAQTSPQAFFLADGADDQLTLMLQDFSAPLVQSALAPDPPVSGEPAQVVVEVDSRSVGSDGVVSYQPLSGAEVSLVAEGAWSISSPDPTLTDPSGDAAWTATCEAEGDQPLAVQIAPAAGSSAPGSTAGGQPTTTATTASTSTTSSASGSSPTPLTGAPLVYLDLPSCAPPPPPPTTTTTTTLPPPTSTSTSTSTAPSSTTTSSSSTTTAPGPSTTILPVPTTRHGGGG